ncbi:MAG: hypothetical protein NUV65_01655 [Candidatus Roizmanbacteria bacterium]|nr:hypothetical protein [Candidatus Roizmanbacteria bacterium]
MIYTIYKEGPHPQWQTTFSSEQATNLSEPTIVRPGETMGNRVTAHHIEFGEITKPPNFSALTGTVILDISEKPRNGSKNSTIADVRLVMTPKVDLSLLKYLPKDELNVPLDLLRVLIRQFLVCTVSDDQLVLMANMNGQPYPLFGINSNGISVNTGILGRHELDLHTNQLQGDEVPFRCYTNGSSTVFEAIYAQTGPSDIPREYEAIYGVTVQGTSITEVNANLRAAAEGVLRGTAPRDYGAFTNRVAQPYIRIQESD